MKKHQFSAGERLAIWTVGGERCWICDEPVSLAEMCVDHVIPESADPSEVAELAGFHHLGAEFEINSFHNWAPSHERCNKKKAARKLRSTVVAIQLDKLATHADRAQKIATKFVANRDIELAISKILGAKEAGILSDLHRDQLRNVIEWVTPHRLPALRDEPLFLAPGLRIVAQDDSFYYLQASGPLSGIRPKAKDLDPSWDCPRCGVTGWNGARCIRCGMLDDGD